MRPGQLFEHSWGSRADELLAYETPKIVRIRDARLGVLYYTLVLCILSYIVGYQIFYNNQHFERRDVVGTTRMTIQQPTKGGCNPNDVGCSSDFPSLESLPYCIQYAGNSSVVKTEHKGNCIFADQHTLSPYGMLGDVMLVPTRIDYMKEKKGCQPRPANDWTCDNEYEVDSRPTSNYIADIEEYTIMLAHSFKRSYVSGNNGEYLGYYMKCEQPDGGDDEVSKMVKATRQTLEGQKTCDGEWKRYPIDCINDKCHFLEREKRAGFLQEPVAGHGGRLGARRSHPHASLASLDRSARGILLKDEELTDDAQEQPPKVKKLLKDGVFAIADGDIFKIRTLLELAGIDLDETRNTKGEPLRESGTVIEIEVTYNNLHPFWSSFGYKEVSYEYKVSKRPMEEMKSEMLALHQPKFPQERIIENVHGLYLIVRLGGTFGFFSGVFLLIVLTTALGLLGVANVLVDKIAIYLLKDKDHYRESKYFLTIPWSQREAERSAESQEDDKLGASPSMGDQD